MPDALEEFAQETIKELLQRLSPEERLKGLATEERLKGLAAEERLKGLSTDEVMRALPPETLAALLRQLKSNGPSGNPQ